MNGSRTAGCGYSLKRCFLSYPRLAVATLTLLFVGLASTAQAQDTQLHPTSSAVRYDGGGRVVGEIGPDPDGAGPLGYPAKRTIYDPTGLVIRVETGELASWQPTSVAPNSWPGFTIHTTQRLSYDTLNQVVKTEVLGQDNVVVSVTQANYDKNGRPACTAVRMNPAAFNSLPASACTLGTAGTMGGDRISRNHYDAAGQKVKIQLAVGTPLQQDYATYTYSLNGKITSMTDAKGFKAAMAYDGFDRQERWSFPSPTTPGVVSNTDYEEYGYDAAGNRIRLRKRDGSEILYSYDNLNRMTVKTVPQRAGLDPTHTRDVYFGYDLRGLSTSARFDSASGEGIDTNYDGFGRATSGTFAMDGTSRTLGSSYDLNGNRTEFTWMDGAKTGYSYDTANRPLAIYEGPVAAGVNMVTFTYNPRGQLSGQQGRYGNATAYTSDPVGRLAAFNHDFAGASHDVSYDFAYNPASQITQNSRSNDAFAWTGHVNVDRGYTTNGLNQYATAGSAAFCYDLNGNLTADGASVFLYDVENRLVEKRAQGAGNTNCAALSYAGALQAALRYDPAGRLYEVIGASGTTRMLYDGDALVAEFDGAGNLLRRYVHGPNPGVDDPLVWYEGAAIGPARWLHRDWQGSITAVSDSANAVILVNRYDEYGIPQCPLVGGAMDCSLPGSNAGRFQYTGQAWIAELGMYYYKARIYSPTLGRFLQTDPIGYGDQLNLYGFVQQDPINHTDSSGQEAVAIYDPITQIIWVGDLQSGRMAAARNVQSGADTLGSSNVKTGPIPAGTYSILERGGSTSNGEKWFRLERQDGNFGDDTTPEGRYALRLHVGSQSAGCVTMCEITQGRTVTSLIGSTSASTTTVDSKSKFDWDGKEAVKDYGTMYVIPGSLSAGKDGAITFTSSNKKNATPRTLCTLSPSGVCLN